MSTVAARMDTELLEETDTVRDAQNTSHLGPLCVLRKQISQ